MRNLKKLFAVVVVIAVMLTTMIPAAFAEDATLSADAKICADLGILTGDTGVTVAYTQTQPARIQALVMLLRLKGVLADAQATSATADNFSDVTAGWMKPLTAYAKAHPEVGFGGIGNNKFDPNSKIDAKQYYSVMLTALGYSGDYTWATVLTKAASVGLTKNLDVTKFTVNDLAVATVEALKAKVKGSDKTLVQVLGAANADFAKKAAAAGIYTAPAATLNVTSVTALNLRQVKVTFNGEVDKTSAEIIGNYLENLVPITAAKAELQSDKKTVLITYTADKAQQSKLSYRVKNVKTTDNLITVTTSDTDVTFTDTTFPTVTSVTVNGNNGMTVKFSEPVSAAAINAANYSLNGNSLTAYGLTTIAWDDAVAPSKQDTVNFTFGVRLPAAAYTLKVSGGVITDDAGFYVTETSVPATVVADTTAPTYVSAVATDLNTLDITFSEKVVMPAQADITINGVVLTGSVIAAKDGDASIVRITKASLLSAGPNLVVIAAGKVSDLYGNTSDGTNAIRFTVSATSDTVKPTVKSLTATNDTTLRVIFSEAMGASALNKANYTIKDASGAAAGTITNITVLAGIDNAYNINLAAAIPGGTYTVTVSNCADTSNNAMVAQTLTVAVTDTTSPVPPTVTLTDAANSKLTVTYAEAMDVASITTNAYYKLSINGAAAAALPAETTFTAAADGKSVVIDLPNNYFGLGLDAAGGDALTVQLSKDTSGNFMNPVTTNVVISAATTLAPTFLRAKVMSDKSIVVEYDKPLSALQFNDYIYNGVAATAGVLQNTKVRNAADTADIDGSQITLTFPDGTIDAAIANSLTTEALLNVNTTDSYGNKIAAGATYTLAGAQLVDKYAPTYANAAVNVTSATTITITFSENLKTTISDLYKNDFTVTNGGAGVTINSASVTGRVLTLTTATMDLAQATVVTPKSTGISVQDTAGNVFVPTSANLNGATAVNASGVSATAVNTPGTAPVAPTMGVYTLTIAGSWDAADTVTIGGVTLTGADVASTASTFDTTTDTPAAIATAIAASVAANPALNALYTVTDNGNGVLTFTQKVYSATALASTEVTAGTGTAVVAQTTASVAPVAGTAQSCTVTVNTGAVITKNITVTVNGVAHTVAVTATNTPAQVATAIQAKLVADGVTGYTVGAVAGASFTLTATSVGVGTPVTFTIAE